VVNLGTVVVNQSHPIMSQIQSNLPGYTSFGSVTSYPTSSDNFGSVADVVSIIGGVMQAVNLGSVTSAA
jgi:hypothetical protein